MPRPRLRRQRAEAGEVVHHGLVRCWNIRAHRTGGLGEVWVRRRHRRQVPKMLTRF